jgi:type I restriction enzyme S subunit
LFILILAFYAIYNTRFSWTFFDVQHFWQKWSLIPIPLPPLTEQYRIVEKIDRLMEQCDRLEKLRKEHHQKRLIIHTAARDRLLNATDQNSLNQSWNFIQNNFGELYSVKENVSELRKIILQLAVMGKLVTQDPSEESALVLFKKIRKNIDELVEQKKEKKIDFENVNNQGFISILPEKWLWVRFGSILNNLKYGTSKKCSYEVNGSAVLRIPNINVETGKIILDDLKYTELSKLELSELSLMPNDLLMIRSNGSENLVGRVAIVTELESDFAYAGYLIRLRFLTQFIYSRYLYFVLNTTFIRKQIERPLRTTSGVKNINSKEIANLLIPLPPLPEQHRIVTKIDQLMKMCDQLEQQIEQSTDKRTKLL